MLDFQVTADPDDRFWKVRLLFTHLNKTAKQYVKIPLKSSIDEGMIKYFGPHPLKQFIRGKPCRFGFKVCFSFFHLLFKVADPDPGGSAKLSLYGENAVPVSVADPDPWNPYHFPGSRSISK